jgi:hypothetical protein
MMKSRIMTRSRRAHMWPLPLPCLALRGLRSFNKKRRVLRGEFVSELTSRWQSLLIASMRMSSSKVCSDECAQ